MAMGATAVRIARSVVGQAIGLALTGMTAGTAIAVLAYRLAASQLQGLGSMSAVPVALAASLLLAIVAAAAWLPAARAARINPAVSLRQE